MMTLHSRSIAEHLCTLASLLEAEAIRANTLGSHNQKNIAHQAHEVRQMANQLWQANIPITLDSAPENTGHNRPTGNISVH